MVPEYPYPSDEWLEYFAGLLKKYDLEPVCWSAYIDMGTRSDRDLTREEIIQCTVNDLIYAKKAGFPLVRTQHAISPEIFRAMISWCKRLDMKLAIEMHHPHHFDVPLWQEYFSVMRGEGKGVLGFVPDFSIFQYRPHQLFLNQAIELGFRSDRLAAVCGQPPNRRSEGKPPLNRIFLLSNGKSRPRSMKNSTVRPVSSSSRSI